MKQSNFHMQYDLFNSIPNYYCKQLINKKKIKNERKRFPTSSTLKTKAEFF